MARRKILTKKKSSSKKVVKPKIKKRLIRSKGIVMTIVAFGVLASLFMIVSFVKQTNQTNLLGAFTYLAKDGGGDSSGSNSGSGSSNSGKDDATEAETEAPHTEEQKTETEHQAEPTSSETHNSTSPEPTHIEPTHSEPTRTETKRPEPTRTELRRPSDPGSRKLTVIPTTKLMKALEKEFDKNLKEASKESLSEVKPTERPKLSVTPSEDKIVFENKAGTKTEVKIIPNKDNTVTLNSGAVSAKTALPISINTDTNKLTVKTGTETKDINVMPDQAIETLKSSNLLDNVTETQGAQGNSQTVVLQNKNGQPTFTVEGTKSKKILGLFTVQIHKTIDVSAETGTVTNVTTPFFDNILSIISI